MTAAEPRPLSNARLLGAARLPLRLMELPFIESPRPQAGFPSPALDYVENALDLNQYLILNPLATFFLRMSGRSMIGAGLFDGDIVIVDRSMQPRPHKIVVAIFCGEFYIKWLRVVDGRSALVSDNPDEGFPTMFLDQDVDHIVWGCVVGSCKRH